MADAALVRAVSLGALLAGCVPAIDAEVERVEVDGAERTAFVHVPAGAPADAPLLLAFHGANLAGAWLGAQFAVDTGFIAQADRDGFVVAFPNSVSGTWADRQGEGADDQAFVEALIAALGDRVDPARVVAAGFSNGAFFSVRVACERPDLVRAVASVSGGLLSGQACAPTAPRSVLLAAGTDDDVVPYDGGGLLWGIGPDAVGHVAAVAQTTSRLGCGPPAIDAASGEDGTAVQVRTHTGCAGGTEVVDVRIDGGGHQWPGPDAPGADAWDATGAIAAFAARAWADAP